MHPKKDFPIKSEREFESVPSLRRPLRNSEHAVWYHSPCSPEVSLRIADQSHVRLTPARVLDVVPRFKFKLARATQADPGFRSPSVYA
jgi:hypothetical protein